VRADDLSSLTDLLPPGVVSTDPDDLMAAGRDWWALAMLREARGDVPALPSAVAFPSSTAEVADVLSWASRTGTPVVPRGGGSGVSGGAQAEPGWLVLDLSRMDRVVEVDEVSQAVTVQAGVRGDRLEEELGRHGLTLGHYPQSIALSTVGGWIAAASAGQASAGYGAVEDLLLGATAVLANGRVLRLRAVPRSAAGPDLRRLLVGSEGTLAVVTEAVLACSPRPPGYAWEGYALDDFAGCMDAFRALVRVPGGPGASVLRAYDEPDALLNFGRAGHAGGCLALVGFASDLPALGARRDAARAVLGDAGGRDVGEAFGLHWWEHRNDAVQTYRRIMGPDRTFGPGVVVDTMEVAGLWSRLPDLYGAVRDALAARAEAVGCHLSHVYHAGSSLYFTFLVRAADDRAVEDAYLSAWEDAVGACLAAGGTMTHHHGVGRLKARFLAGELGGEGVDVLRRIKSVLDPAGVLNPGSLLP
jgi:alkyldihydroxyacetonephosphate synthase